MTVFFLMDLMENKQHEWHHWREKMGPRSPLLSVFEMTKTIVPMQTQTNINNKKIMSTFLFISCEFFVLLNYIKGMDFNFIEV